LAIATIASVIKSKQDPTAKKKAGRILSRKKLEDTAPKNVTKSQNLNKGRLQAEEFALLATGPTLS
jgi:hypothetical protein